LSDVDTLISDPYDGLKAALRQTLPGTEWQARTNQTGLIPQAFISAVTPLLWVDSSVPGGSITSGLSSMWDATLPIWGRVDVSEEIDNTFMTRLLGILFMEMQNTWTVSREVVILD
jgi:hypothetical protein